MLLLKSICFQVGQQAAVPCQFKTMLCHQVTFKVLLVRNVKSLIATDMCSNSSSCSLHRPLGMRTSSLRLYAPSWLWDRPQCITEWQLHPLPPLSPPTALCQSTPLSLPLQLVGEQSWLVFTRSLQGWRWLRWANTILSQAPERRGTKNYLQLVSSIWIERVWTNKLINLRQKLSLSYQLYMHCLWKAFPLVPHYSRSSNLTCHIYRSFPP